MNTKVERNYLEINSIQELNDSNKVDERFTIQYLKNTDFQINKFFYKNVGKNITGWTDLFGQKKNGLIMFLIKT